MTLKKCIKEESLQNLEILAISYLQNNAAKFDPSSSVRMKGHVKEDHVCACRSFMYRSCIGHVVSCRCIDLGVVHVVQGMYVLVM